MLSVTNVGVNTLLHKENYFCNLLFKSLSISKPNDYTDLGDF